MGIAFIPWLFLGRMNKAGHNEKKEKTQIHRVGSIANKNIPKVLSN